MSKLIHLVKRTKNGEVPILANESQVSALLNDERFYLPEAPEKSGKKGKSKGTEEPEVPEQE